MRFKYEARKIPYIIYANYTPDFEYEVQNGIVIVETKGYFRPEDRRKLAAVKRQHPEIDIRIVFYRSVPTYIKWANRNGFRYAIGEIPEDWLRGL